jgi:hypothetical protein
VRYRAKLIMEEGGKQRSGALGALEPKKVKAARRAGWALVERVSKTAPQGQ